MNCYDYSWVSMHIIIKCMQVVKEHFKRKGYTAADQRVKVEVAHDDDYLVVSAKSLTASWTVQEQQVL